MGGLFSKSYSEGFDPLRPNPPPLSGHEAENCLFISEFIDGYRNKISKSPVNLKARYGQNYRTADYFVKTPITESKSGPWWSGQVLWLKSNADGGLPHTRPPGYICLPENITEAILPMTLLHERVHLHQRRYPDIWTSFFKKSWNMKIWNGILPPEIDNKRRLNPDLLPIPFFIWNDIWVPICLYKDTGNPTLTGAATAWYNSAQKVLSMTAPDGWYSFFGYVPDDEHPWELAAYYIADPRLTAPAKDLLMKLVPTLPSTFVSR